MDEFISMVTDKLGVGEKESRAATGGILGMLKGKLDDSMFGSIIEKIPGADALLGEAEAAPQEEAGGGGLMGSLSSMAGGLMGGGKAGGAAEVAGLLGSSGIGMDKIPGFLSMLVGFLKEKLGDDMFGSMASKLPDLFGGDDK